MIAFEEFVEQPNSVWWPEKVWRVIVLFFKAWLTGSAMIFGEILAVSVKFFNKNYKFSRTSVKPEDDEEVGISYGFAKMSKLFAGCFLLTPTFILDISKSSFQTKAFIAFNQICNILFASTGYYGMYLLYSRSLDQILPGLNSKVLKLMSRMLLISELFLVLLEIMVVTYLIYYRRFMFNFLTQESSTMNFKRSFQLRKLMDIFSVVFLTTFFSEPMFTLLTTTQIFKQPLFLPTLSKASFLAFKFIFIHFLVTFIWIMGMCNQLVPVMISYLICMIEKYIRIELEKQLSRLEQNSGDDRRDSYNRKLQKLTADSRLAEMIENHALDTICLGFPEFNVKKKVQFHVDPKAVNKGLPKSREHSSASDPNSLVVGGRIFLFINLTKRLSEIKEIIRSFERVYGSIHWMSICSNALLVSQWVVIGIVQLRLTPSKEELDPIPMETRHISFPFRSVFDNPLISRTIWSLTIFGISNTIMFMRCDIIQKRMEMLRNQLFQLNLNSCKLSLKYAKYEHQQSLVGEWRELDLLWSLYDQVARLSGEINFRFFSQTNYGKKCLLLIFSRAISLILLYLQVIDIYSNT